MNKCLIVITAAVLSCGSVYGQECEQTLDPPVLRSAPEDGALIETCDYYYGVHVQIQWYLLQEGSRIDYQIAADKDFALLIKFGDFINADEYGYASLGFDDVGTFYWRIRSAGYNTCGDWVSSEWVTRKLTIVNIECEEGETEEGEPVEGEELTLEGIFNTVDANNDNQLSPSEVYAVFPDFYTLDFDELDTDENGYLSFEELQGNDDDTQPRRILEIEVSPELSGEIIATPEIPDNGYVHATPVVLSAIANNGYEFSHWRGGYTFNEDEMHLPVVQISMYKDTKIIAVFMPIENGGLFSCIQKSKSLDITGNVKRIITDWFLPGL